MIVTVAESIETRAAVNVNLWPPSDLKFCILTRPFVLVTEKSAARETDPSELNVKFPLKLADKVCPGITIPPAKYKIHGADTVVDPEVDN